MIDDMINLLLNKEIEGNNPTKYILNSFTKCFLFDTEGFVNKEKFDKILQPIVDQLDQTSNEDSNEWDEKINILTECLSQLAVNVGNDTLWKPLNYQVLLKTRSQVPKVRLAALRVVQKCYTKLGEELLVLLPETIPFLAELMEDSDPTVEKLTQEIIQDIEKYLGEEDSIKNYL